MNSIKIAFFDIDGTLYDHNHGHWDLGALKAIQTLKGKGIKVFLSTARPYDSLKRFGALELGIDWDGYTASAGALGVAEGKTIREMRFDPRTVRAFIASARELGLSLEAVGPRSRILVLPSNEDARLFYDVYHEEKPPLNPYQGEATIALNLFSPAHTDRALFGQFPELFFYRYFPHAVDVTISANEKGAAIHDVLEHYGFAAAEAIGFGDDNQDISFCLEVGQFVCMGNGQEELKSLATYVTTPVWEDGVANGLRHYGLI